MNPAALIWAALRPLPPEAARIVRQFRRRTVVRSPQRAAVADPAARRILDEVLDRYRLQLSDLRWARRNSVEARARFAICARLYHETDLSFEAIAGLVGYHDHTSAIYAAEAGSAALGLPWTRSANPRRASRQTTRASRARFAGFDPTERSLTR